MLNLSNMCSIRAGDPIDYSKLRGILNGIAKRKQIEFDGAYDWSEPQHDDGGNEKAMPDPLAGTLRVKSEKSKRRKEKKREKRKWRERDARA